MPKYYRRKQKDEIIFSPVEVGTITCIISIHILPHLHFIGEKTRAYNLIYGSIFKVTKVEMRYKPKYVGLQSLCSSHKTTLLQKGIEGLRVKGKDIHF